MDEAALRCIRECKWSRRALEELAALVPTDEAELDRWLGEIVAARDEKAFGPLLLAALEAGRKVDARHLVEGAVLFGGFEELASATCHMTGNVGAALIEAVRRGHMELDQASVALLLAGFWCRDKNGGEFPHELGATARQMARRHGHDLFVGGNLMALAEVMEDPGLRAILEGHLPANLNLAPILHGKYVAPCQKSPLALVPEQAPTVVAAGYTVRRAVPRLGRNDPCHCGSGKKYKKCCFDKDCERLTHSSEVEGKTVEEFKLEPEPFLTAEHLREMRSFELVKLDPTKLSPALYHGFIRQLLIFKEFEAVAGFFERIPYTPALEGVWDEAANWVTAEGRKDILDQLLEARRNDPPKPDALGIDGQLLLARGDASRSLELIETTGLRGLQLENAQVSQELVELAFALLASPYPALGILLARSVLPKAHPLDAMTLMDELLDTRDKLQLPFDDPSEAILERRFEEEADEKFHDSKELTEARHALAAKNEEMREAKAAVERLRCELAAKEKQQARRAATPAQPAAAPKVTTEDAALRDLQRRMAQLKATLKERHNERNRLRRELQETREYLEQLSQKSDTSPATLSEVASATEEDLLLPEEDLGAQPVRLPSFPKGFLEAQSGWPKAVNRAAISMAGRLAAGEPGAFVGVKRLKANRDIYRQRVAGDYRLLFRLRAETLEVIDLIHRKELERKIKALT